MSVILHFPPEVYLSRGLGDLCPQLVRAWYVKKISAPQFRRGGRVRITVCEPAFREELLTNDMFFEGRKIPVTPAGVHTVTVYLRDLPVELSDESIKSTLSLYGEVYSIRHAYFKEFPELHNGNRLLLMSVRKEIPSSLNVLGFQCRTCHPGQAVNCSICKAPCHSPRTCPLSGLCRRCRQPDHVARECGQAWGQPHSSAPSSVPDPVPASSPFPDPVVPSSPVVPLSPVVPSSPDVTSSPVDKTSLPDPPDKYIDMDPSDFKKAAEKQLSRYRKLNDGSLGQIVQSLVDALSIPSRL